LDNMGDAGKKYRNPSDMKPVFGIEVKGWMHPKNQLLETLNMFSDEFQAAYGCSFKTQQTSGNTIADINRELQAGNLVIVHGLSEVPDKDVRRWLGGTPHTMGAVATINWNASTISVLNTYPDPVTKGLMYEKPLQEFEQWWGRKNTLDLYTEPNTMTVLIPDTVCSPVNTATATPTISPAVTPSVSPASPPTPPSPNMPSGTPTP
jgi:hypothetical protein